MAISQTKPICEVEWQGSNGLVCWPNEANFRGILGAANGRMERGFLRNEANFGYLSGAGRRRTLGRDHEKTMARRVAEKSRVRKRSYPPSG